MQDESASQRSAPQTGTSDARRLSISIYQLAGDDMFLGRRPDGTGWDWSPADWRRNWMDETPGKFAYRCLPLTIANQTGWCVYNPVGFTAVWNGRSEPGSIGFLFDSDPKTWSGWINDQFGHGVITWNTPFLFRTHGLGSRLLVNGPANYFKHGVQPLTAIIESDWMNMSFTMNWKITSSKLTVRFDQGEPLFHAIPLSSNLCADWEDASVRYMRLQEDPEVATAYQNWQNDRKTFHERKRAGEVRPDDWQKDYFRGRDESAGQIVSGHTTKVTPPKITYVSPRP